MATLLTNSSLRTFRECPRRFQNSYVRLRRPVRTPKPLAFGTVIHAGLASAWEYARTHVSWPEPGRALYGALACARHAAEPHLESDALTEVDLVRAEVMLTCYVARWAPAMQEWEVLDVEEEWSSDLVNPQTGRRSRTYTLGGKRDALARRRADGSMWVIEHKTTGEDVSAGSVYWQKLRLDMQVSMYYDGARRRGYDVAGVLYDVLVKPRADLLLATPEDARKYTKGKPCKACGGSDARGETPQPGSGLAPDVGECQKCGGAGWVEPPRIYAYQRADDETIEEYRGRLMEMMTTAPDEWFARAEVVRLEDDVAEHALDIWLTAKSIHEHALAGVYPRNPEACFSHGKEPCPYWSVCTGAADLADPTIFRDASSPHEELAVHPEGRTHVSASSTEDV